MPVRRGKSLSAPSRIVALEELKALTGKVLEKDTKGVDRRRTAGIASLAMNIFALSCLTF